jgi:hypothetical protein
MSPPRWTPITPRSDFHQFPVLALARKTAPISWLLAAKKRGKPVMPTSLRPGVNVERQFIFRRLS